MSGLLAVLLFFNVGFLHAQQVKVLPLPGAEMVFAKTKGKIIASGKALSGGGFYNRLYEVDPFSGKMEEMIAFDSWISHLRLSKDESLLYVKYATGDTSIVALDLTDYSMEYALQLGKDAFNDPYRAIDFAASPQDPRQLVVVRSSDSGSNAKMEVCIYDNGVRRPNFHEGTRGLDRILFLDSPDHLYGWKISTNSDPLIQFQYDANGVQQEINTFSYLSDALSIVEANGKLYDWEGKVISIVQDSVEMEMDYAWSGTNYRGLLPRPNEGLLYGTRYATDGQIIDVRDIDQYQLLESFLIPAPSNSFSAFTPLDQGYSFAYIHLEELVIILDCVGDPTPAVMDPVYQDRQIVCDADNLIIYPPAGYDFLYDENGTAYQSFVAIQDGNYSFRLATPDGCLTAPSEPIEVFFAPTPDRPRTYDLNDQGEYTFGVDTIFGCDQGKAFLYGWNSNSVPDHNIVWSTGDTGVYLATTFLGEIYCQTMNVFGCLSDPSSSRIIASRPGQMPDPPAILGTYPGNNIPDDCSGNFIGYVRAEPGYEAYHWRGTLGSSYGPNYGAQGISPQTQSVLLQGKNTAGCWSDPVEGHIRLYEAGTTPVINANVNHLSAPPGVNYTWYLDGVIIPDSDTQVYVAQEPGTYQVKVFNGQCWGPISAEVILP